MARNNRRFLHSAEIYVMLTAARKRRVLPIRQAVGPFCGGSFLAPGRKKGGGAMITYPELFQFCILIVSIISLVIQAKKK